MRMFNPERMDSVVRGILKSEGYNLVYHDESDKLAYTDGTNMYVPRPSLDWNEEKRALWNYSVFHEQGHNSESCRDAFAFGKERVAKGASKFKMQMLNVVEDYRQERLNHGAYSGRDEAMEQGRLLWSRLGRTEVSETLPNGFAGDDTDINEESYTTLYRFTDWLRANGTPAFMPSLSALDECEHLSARGRDWMDQLQRDHTDLESCETVEQVYRWLERVLRDVFKIETQEEQDEEEQREPDYSQPEDGEGEQQDGDGQNEVMSRVSKYEFTVDNHEDEESNPQGLKLLYSDSEPDVHGVYRGNRVLDRGRSKYPVITPNNNLAKQVQRLLTIRSRSRWEEGYKRGRLGRRVARVALDNDRVFRQKSEVISLDKSVVVLVDCSGSMYGDKMDQAKVACALLADAITPLGVPLEILGFQDGNHYRHRGEALPTIYEVMKFGQRYNKDTLHKRINQLESDGCNDDFSALLYAYNRLMQQKTAGHALIVLSDGSPAPTNYNNQMEAVKKLVKKLETRIEVYGIGIQDPNVRRIYKKHHVVHDTADLSPAILNFIKQSMLK